MIQLLGSMKISVKLPVMVGVDNVDATFMAHNITITPGTKHMDIRYLKMEQTTTCHTKHMDIQYNYVNEYVEDGVVKIVFVESAENDSNILTKNLSAQLHDKHSKKMVGEKLEEVEIFEVERKGVRCIVLTSNFCEEYFKNEKKSNMTAGRDRQLCQLKLVPIKK